MHAGCGHDDPTLSFMGMVMVVSFEHAGCGHCDHTMSMLGVVMVISL